MNEERTVSEEMIPARRDLPPGRVTLRRTHLIGQITEHPRSRGLRWALLSSLGALVVGASMAAGGYFLTQDEVTHFESVGCFEESTPDGNVAIVNASGADPAEVCAGVWAEGALGSGGQAPPLVACVLSTGPVGVFPSLGEDTCGRLGLADLPSDYAATAEELAQLENSLAERSLLAGCLDRETANTVAREELDQEGYADWSIEEGPGPSGEGFTDAFPCADFILEPSKSRILLVFFEQPPVYIGCFAEASFEADVRVEHMGGRAPADHCAQLWATGVLGGGSAEPLLVACGHPGEWNAYVFPGAEAAVCAAQGLAAWQPSVDDGLPRNSEDVPPQDTPN